MAPQASLEPFRGCPRSCFRNALSYQHRLCRVCTSPRQQQSFSMSSRQQQSLSMLLDVSEPSRLIHLLVSKRAVYSAFLSGAGGAEGSPGAPALGICDDTCKGGRRQQRGLDGSLSATRAVQSQEGPFNHKKSRLRERGSPGHARLGDL